MQEIWRDCISWENYYAVSTIGTVRSLPRTVIGRDNITRRISGRILTPGINTKDGYAHYSFYRNGILTTVKGHALVLDAFVGPCPPGYLRRHLNDIPSDNYLTNLAYGTPTDNILDRIRNSLTCKREHLLMIPNLRNNFVTNSLGRRCLACHRATAQYERIIARGQSADINQLADQYYTEIMRGWVL
jgi:hypothetical protein